MSHRVTPSLMVFKEVLNSAKDLTEFIDTKRTQEEIDQ